MLPKIFNKLLNIFHEIVNMISFFINILPKCSTREIQLVLLLFSVKFHLKFSIFAEQEYMYKPKEMALKGHSLL